MTIWPVNYAEQFLLVDALSKRRDRINKVRQPILLNSIPTPTQAQWEAAYVSQTGQRLPIIPGTRLLWRHPQTGQMVAFTTAYDENNGAESSGTVYRYTGETYDRGAFRLLGSMRAGMGPRSVLYNSHAPTPRFTASYLQDTPCLDYDLIGESLRNLSSIIVIGTISQSSIFKVAFGTGSEIRTKLWNSANKLNGINPAGQISARLTNSTSAGANADVGSNATLNMILNLSEVPLLPSTIWMKINMPSIGTYLGNPIAGGPGLDVTCFASGQTGATLAANGTQIELNQGMRYNALPLYERLRFELSTNASSYVPSIPRNISRVYIYGLYENNNEPTGPY